MKKLIMFMISSIIAFASCISSAQTRDPNIGDFSLIDQEGVYHNLSWYDNNDFVVIVAADDETIPDIDNIVDVYEGVSAQIFLIAQSAVQGVDVPVLIDDTTVISKQLGLQRYGDLVVIDPTLLRVRTRVPGAGAEIQYPTVGELSYANDIAPIIAENCASCHREGGIAPFAFDSYQMLRGWSPMVKEVLMTKQMPPGQVDPHIGGPFVNGRTLEREELQKIISWIDSGSLNNDVTDPLTELTWPESEWAYGEPDLIIELPPQEIPATGVIPYRYTRVTLDNHTEDRWIRASQYLPGDPTVLHHTLHTITAPGEERGGNLLGSVGDAGEVSDAPQITAYVPGAEPVMAPENTGSLLKAGSVIDFQLHYTTSGKESIDVSRIGVWFYPKGEEPEKRMVGNCACIFTDTWVNIPPYDPAYQMTESITIPRDAYIHSFLPHMHFRGKSMEFIAKYPNGQYETLINIANYDYAWQLSYTYEEPHWVPGGTEIIVNGVFDNSEQNPANPDPSRSVPWGQMSWDEMFFGVVNWQYVE